VNRSIVFLDTEQDSLHPGRRAYEIAMIRRDDLGDGIAAQKEISFFVSLNLCNSDPAALAVGRFFDRHPAGRKISGKPVLPGAQVVYSVHDAAKTVMEWTFGATIVGAVPSFDTETLAKLLRAEGYLPSWHHRLRCVETALGDARLAMRVFDACMADENASAAADPEVA